MRVIDRLPSKQRWLRSVSCLPFLCNRWRHVFNLVSSYSRENSGNVDQAELSMLCLGLGCVFLFCPVL